MAAVETPAIQKTPGVCGGDACIRRTRIPVWLIVNARRLGETDAELLDDYPGLTQADLDACWDYYGEHPIEIEQGIWFNDTAANVPDGTPPPVWVLVSGRLLGLTDSEIRESFEPPLAAADLDMAWAAYRADPARVGRDIAMYRLAG
jgi:uncharacterized protein (DUF433 family)